MEYTQTDPSRVNSADITKPLLIAIDELTQKLVVVDGAHRLARAKREHVQHLSGILLTPKMLEAARIPNSPKYLNW